MKKYVYFLLLIVFTVSFYTVSTVAVDEVVQLSGVSISEENKSDTITDFEEPACKVEEVVSLDGKTIMMVGNSMLYYGNCVVFGDQGKEDEGYFYQLISANGEYARVIDHTYSGKTLKYIYNTYLSKLSQSERDKVDYVVLAEANKNNKDVFRDCMDIKALFPEKTEIIFMCNPMMHYSNFEDILNGVKELRNNNVDIVDWGKLVYEVYNGITKVPGGTKNYDFCSFIKDNLYVMDDKGNITENPKGGDNKHPNPLSGYISAQMLYSSITNRSALYTDYSFCNDSGLNASFDIDAFALKHYTGVKTTNFTDIFRSPADMFGLQELIDKYLSEEGKHLICVSEAVEPGCVSGGLSQGYFCTVCNETVREQEYIQSKGGHKIRFDKAVAPTCTQAGKSGSAYCTVCKEYLIKAEVLSATGHSDTTVIKYASVGKDGRKIVNCTVCKKTLSDVKISKIASVALGTEQYVYDEKKKKPKVVVKNGEGKNLELDKDYTVTYPDGCTEIGKYKVRVDFKGKYSGSKTLTFKIVPGVTSSVSYKSYLNSVKLTWKKVDNATGYRIYLYNTKKKKYEKYTDTTKRTLKVNKLKSGQKYKFRIKAYTVVGDKKYFSSKYKNYSVITKPAKIDFKTLNSRRSGEAELKWTKVTGADGYRVYYSEKKDFKSYKKMTVSKGKTDSAVVKKLKSGKRYYFKIRAYKSLNGKKVYGSYSTVKSVVTRW